MHSTPISHLHDEVVALYEEIGSYLGTANALYSKYPYLAQPNQLRGYVKTEVQSKEVDYEMVEANVRLAKSNQRVSDLNRIANKTFREHARIENAVSAYSSAILAELEVHGKALGECPRRTGELSPDAAAIVVHLSDNHFNELVNLPTNRFDFEVAAKRLALLAQKTKLIGKAYGVERVVVFFGGDLMNSDRRLDELLAMSTNRARATLLAVHLYKQFLLDLRSEFFVDCFGITGNESRVKDDLGWVDVVATDSYDFTIYAMLQAVFEATDDKGMRFHKPMKSSSRYTARRSWGFMGTRLTRQTRRRSKQWSESTQPRESTSPTFSVDTSTPLWYLTTFPGTLVSWALTPILRKHWASCRKQPR